MKEKDLPYLVEFLQLVRYLEDSDWLDKGDFPDNLRTVSPC